MESTDQGKDREAVASLLPGMRVSEARTELAKHGYTLRVMKTEKGNLIGTCDFVPSRVNVAIKDEIVTEVLGYQ